MKNRSAAPIKSELTKISFSVDYSLSFFDMLQYCNIPEYQIYEIKNKLNGQNILFDYDKIVQFECHFFTFEKPITIENVKKFIEDGKNKTKFEPFDVEHLLFLWIHHPHNEIFKRNIIFASKRFFDINGVKYFFVFEVTKFKNQESKISIEMLQDINHAWAPGLSVFPGQRKL